jgi:hypothetical protein
MNYKKLFKTKRLKKQGDDKLMEVAYHEAGHALIDLLYGLIPPKATIVPDYASRTAGSVEIAVQAAITYSCGETVTERFEDFQEYMSLVHEIEIDDQKALEYHSQDQLAGIIAGAIYSGRYDWRCITDLDSMIQYFVHFGYYEIPSLQPYWDKTFELLKNNESLLKEIAETLYKKKTLTADYFKTIIEKVRDKSIILSLKADSQQ